MIDYKDNKIIMKNAKYFCEQQSEDPWLFLDFYSDRLFYTWGYIYISYPIFHFITYVWCLMKYKRWCEKVSISCVPGYNGGLDQKFTAELYSRWRISLYVAHYEWKNLVLNLKVLSEHDTSSSSALNMRVSKQQQNKQIKNI